MDRIALNFLPLSSHEFTFTLYRLPFVEGDRPRVGEEAAVRRTLEEDGERSTYWTLFQRIEGSTDVQCNPFDNTYATLAALRMAMIQSCRNNLDSDSFQILGGFLPRVEVTTKIYPEGSQVVSLQSYFLRSRRKFGFLVDFQFHPVAEHRGTYRAQQLSLSLDRHNQPNRNRYADRYSHLLRFVKDFHSSVFSLTLPGGHPINVDSNFVKLTPTRLDIKHYVVGSGSESRSQFMGVKRKGPLKDVPNDDTHLCFLYRPADRSLSHDLFRALRGDTFPTFPGMERMFHFSLRNEHVSGIPISGYRGRELERIVNQVVAEADGSKVVPIVLTPFSRHDNLKDNDQYWLLKHAFLARNLPLQVVTTETVANKNKLKWSTAGIGLQVFAKAGGTPWKVRPRTTRCLIVGIGQAHRVTDSGIDRYFAYSVLTDSGGVFKEVRVLGKNRDARHYMRDFAQNLRIIFSDYSDRFSNFVVHTTFAIRQCELDAIASVLSDQQSQSAGGEFVSLKFNYRNRFFGFALEHNSRVPYESTVMSLSRKEFLVWFEGLQYGHSIVRGMIGGPLHVEFTYPREDLSLEKKRSHLQDAINLSGANWRGFNAKSLPVSVYYAQLIARYLKEFHKQGLPPVNVNTLTPWFL